MKLICAILFTFMFFNKICGQSDTANVLQEALSFEKIHKYFYKDKMLNGNTLMIIDNGIVSSNLQVSMCNNPVIFSRDFVELNTSHFWLKIDSLFINSNKANIYMSTSFCEEVVNTPLAWECHTVDGVNVHFTLEKSRRKWKICSHKIKIINETKGGKI